MMCSSPKSTRQQDILCLGMAKVQAAATAKGSKRAVDQKAARPTVNPPNLRDYCHKLHWPPGRNCNTQKPKAQTKIKCQKNVSTENCFDTHDCGLRLWQPQQQTVSGKAAQFESTVVLTPDLVLSGQYGVYECVNKSLCGHGMCGLKKEVQARSKFESEYAFSIWLHIDKNHKHNNETQNDDITAK